MDHDPMAELPPELKQNMTRYKAPPGLKRRIHYMLTQQSRGPGRLASAWASRSRWAPVAASFAGGALLAAALMSLRPAPGGEDSMEAQVVSSHVRSLLGAHLMDVASNDQHTVKPWFTGKLDYAPPVADLADEGFPLVGGRLDYLQGRTTAALVYRRHSHTINVFVLPEREASRSASGPIADHGYQLARWNHGGMRFWAVSDLSADEMAKFATAMQAAP